MTYGSYLQLSPLLDLQKPLSEGPEHDEMLFIIIHQVYELWFKEIIHELDFLQTCLDQDDIPRCQHTLKRVRSILKVIVSQLDILETMTPQEFLSFRDRLEASSGFQSYQFRAIECLFGLKKSNLLESFKEDHASYELVKKRLESPSIWDSLVHHLARQGHNIPKDVLSRDVTLTLEPNDQVQQVLIDIYRNNTMLTEFCELLVDLDEGMQEWRYHHVKMVQRTIGNKRGTGGTTGVKYLVSTLMKPFFPDLWEIRTEL